MCSTRLRSSQLCFNSVGIWGIHLSTACPPLPQTFQTSQAIPKNCRYCCSNSGTVCPTPGARIAWNVLPNVAFEYPFGSALSDVFDTGVAGSPSTVVHCLTASAKFCTFSTVSLRASTRQPHPRLGQKEDSRRAVPYLNLWPCPIKPGKRISNPLRPLRAAQHKLPLRTLLVP